MKKKLIFAIAMLFLLFASTGVSYALFHFSTDSTVIKNICVDRIKENYEFSGSKYVSKDIFKVYFFPQPRYATGGKKVSTKAQVDAVTKDQIIGYIPTVNAAVTGNTTEGISNTRNNKSGSFGKFDGYFNYSPTITDNELKPNIQTVDSALQDNILQVVGIPKCDMKDSEGNGFEMFFSGWTANQFVAADLGYGGTGDFKLLQTHTPLSIIDKLDSNGKEVRFEDAVNPDGTSKKVKSVDGSYCYDGEIFAYPIFTSGKDYSKGRANQLDFISLENNNASYKSLMSLYDDKTFINDGLAYISTPIHLGKNDNNTIYNLDLRFYYGTYGNDWCDPSFTKNPKAEFSALLLNNQKVTDTRLQNVKLSELNLVPDTKGSTIDATNPFYKKSRQGDYTIYMYVINNGIKSGDFNKYSETYMPTALQGKKISDIFYLKRQTWRNGFFSNYEVEAWIYVEEKSNYKIVGGNSFSFDPYDNATYLNPIDKEATTLMAHNIMANNLDTIFTYYSKYDINNQISQTKFKHQFKKRVFSIVPTSSNPSIGIESKYEIQIKDNDPRTPGTQNEYLDWAVSSDTDPINWDYKVDNNSYFPKFFAGKFLKLKKGGTLDITCEVSYITTKAGTTKLITVDAEPVNQPLFIAIFNDISDIKLDADNRFIDFSASATPRYITDDRIANTLAGFTPIKLGDNLTQSTEFVELKKGANGQYNYSKLTIKDIYLSLPKGYTLYDYVTGSPIRIEQGAEDIMFRNRVYYIGPVKK